LGKETPETVMNRKVNFYDDTEENQIKRHNEIAKIKDRINRQNDTDKDGGALSYVVLSFEDYKSKQAFMLRFGLGINDKYVDGDWFGDIIERTE
jgi:hypothetical protein